MAITDHTVLGPIVADGDLTFEADAALTKFGLVYVSAAGKVTLSGTSDVPIGIVDRAYADLDKEVSVLLLSRGRVLHMVAAGAVAVGAGVTMAAAGKVDDGVIGTNHIIGVALTAATLDGDVIQVVTL